MTRTLVLALLLVLLVSGCVLGPICPPYSADPYAIVCVPG
jgi:hypothetical protein